ncbi:carbohydrate kinase family protein [Clostridium aminobutyricum]|uniref:Carbohydrate kinase family protein n=1 Tax=Clostridium aminobutyricum TaxID=33953 RepID=A0A939D855_CLOAM|nr:carbohydrate kinase family protein [Clostridium aminobutyricum]MBN7772906.1 carbohydrate kinase family protein [Clostridium aminobutyricum]
MIECVIFGGLLLDKYYEIEALPERGQDGFITNEFDCVGGCSVNMAATFNNLGGNAHIVSYIGSDATGMAILDYLQENHFSTRYVVQKNGQTGYSMVFLEPNGERTFLTKAGLELDFTREIIADRLHGIQFAAVTGYFLLNPAASVILDVLEEFHAAGGTILFDPSPMAHAIDAEICRRILHISRIITPNTSEIGWLAASVNPTGNSPSEEAVQAWLDEFIDAGNTVVLKRGSQGGSVYDKSGAFDYEAQKVKTVDTTGAGDSFAAGLIYGIAEGRELREVIRLAVRCAAVTVGINRPHGFWKLEEK